MLRRLASYPASRMSRSISLFGITKAVPAAETTFSSIIVEPKSSTPDRRLICPIFGPCVTHEACRWGKLSSSIREMAMVRR